MKLGLGLYRHMLTRENFQFARQAGATHIVAHFVDYFRGNPGVNANDQPTGTDLGWGLAGDPDKLWTLEDMLAVRREAESCGLRVEAIENFDPAHWHDILLDGPKRALHVENVRTILRRMGEAEIPIMGYNFSLAGVAGRTKGNYARGDAPSVGMEGTYDLPMPTGMVWNMIYDTSLLGKGVVAPISQDELWRRLGNFLNDVLPTAEKAGVRMALHPDDPPTPTVREQPRLVYQPSLYQRVLDMSASRSNSLEFCIGSLAEMTEGDIYEAVEAYSAQGRLGYVHFRNIVGKAPHYKETFIDDGDVDMMRVLRILKRNRFEGVLIPDHTPQMSCAAPWHAGMAYAMGYMKAAMKSLDL